MANGQIESYWACYFSILRLFSPLDVRELWDRWPEDENTAKLWTFTFPDEEARRDPAKALKRWTPFAKWLLQNGFRCVRVLEAGTLRGAWHIHAVTPDYWPVQRIRPAAMRYGFGRINVKPIPASKARYIAKYLGKRFSDTGAKGFRKWGCIGFQGLTAQQIRVTKKVDWIVPLEHHPLCDTLTVRIDGIPAHVVRLRDTPTGESVVNRDMNIKSHWSPVILNTLAAGKICVLGEYRGCEAITKKVNSYEGGKLAGKVSRIAVVHYVEVGRGESLKFREMLPDPDNRAEGVDVSDTVKAPAGRGDMVLVVVTNMSDKWGHDCESITNLSGVGDIGTKGTK